MKASPPITDLVWGRIEVEGSGVFRDAKLWPGGAREWDWSETGTHHLPGIQPADLTELLEGGAELVILSRGVLKRLRTMPATLAFLEERGVEAHVLQTNSAVDAYNALAAAGKPVGALIHSTC